MNTTSTTLTTSRTKAALAVLALSLTGTFATVACGTEGAGSPATANDVAPTYTGEDAQTTVRARAERADAQRWARGHERTHVRCEVSEAVAQRWVRNGYTLPECTTARDRFSHHPRTPR